MSENQSISYSGDYSAERNIMQSSFMWLSLGLLVTSLVAYTVSESPDVLSLMIKGESMTVFGYLIMFAPLGFVLIMSFGFRQLPYLVLLILYLAYTVLIGASLSFIFLIYTSESISSTLLSTALMFGVMAVIGYFTKMDLTKLGNIFMMGLFGIITVTIVSMFVKSDSFSLIISFASIVLFCGLTAWDTQKLKALCEESLDEETKSKIGLLCALTLYLDFINIFLSMLRITGRKRKVFF